MAKLCVPHFLPLQHKYKPKRKPEIDERRANKRRLSEVRLNLPVINEALDYKHIIMRNR